MLFPSIRRCLDVIFGVDPEMQYRYTRLSQIELLLPVLSSSGYTLVTVTQSGKSAVSLRSREASLTGSPNI
jgi:hypothetical protein